MADTLPPPPPPPEIPATILPELESPARVGLLQSIRQSGGVGRVPLRSAKQDFTPKPKKIEGLAPKKPVGPGDLMKDMKSMLAQRKKGAAMPRK